MAKTSNERYNQIASELSNGINIDIDPSSQPIGSRRFTLNTVEKTSENQTNLANEPSNISCTTFPDRYCPIGDRYIGSGNTFVILHNQDTNRQDLGLVDSNDIYSSLVNTGLLTCDIRNQCEIKFRVRKGNERVVYWVDGLNNARTLNIDRLYDFYNLDYKNYLKVGGNPDTYTGEKWDAASFDLIKSYSSIPTFNNVEIIEYGNILPGSYNFAIQYVDEDLNPTAWITTSNTVNIYNDTIDSLFAKIRGSRNIDTTSQSFPRANKTIKLTIGNLDVSFPYYRIGIIRAAGNSGEPEKVLLSDLNSTFQDTFLYSGNDSELKEVQLGDILIDKGIIYSPKHISQQENILLLAHTKGKGINWCEFQKYASKIKSDFTSKEVILNSAFSDPNVKNPKSTFFFRGYMPGEVYSFGIVYIFRDGYISPVFHIPGRNENDSNSDMMFHDLDTKYLDIHNCSGGDYWGVDNLGETLVGKNVRHHRFPFRKDVGKPLVTSSNTSTNINKYKLSLVISLNPDYTPEPSYPEDGDGNPLVIGYKIKYRVTGAATDTSITGSLVDTDVSGGRSIIIYDDTISLNNSFSGEYFLLDSSSELASYQDGSNDRFIITPTYTSYVVSTVQNTDSSEIFGIEFGNITRPHSDVIGFYIVRNEREEGDKIVVDNAIFGTMTESNNFKSFGLVMPKQYYEANNCGRVDNSGKTLAFSDDSLWFFSPEYQYSQKKSDFENIVIEGRYMEDSYDMPTVSNIEGSTCNLNGSKGIYIEDVQAGTSYNPDINKAKSKDDDGFDLIVGYRNTNTNFVPNTTNMNINDKDRAMYLTAASYQNYNSKTYYNVSVDNKIGICTFSNPFNINKIRNNADNKNNLLYGSMTNDNRISYSNFIERPYFKEINNPILFEDENVINGVEVFNGDAQISSFNLISSVFYDMVVADRPKKNSLWKIIVGSILIVAGIALAFTGVGLGISAAGVVALTSAAISYGVSLAVSGIKFDQFQAMIQTDYEKGLKDTVTDGGVYETIRENIETEDDTIRWFSDRLSNIYIESSVPFGLRSGLTCGVPDFIDAPDNYDENTFRSYLIEKLTSIDRDQGSGRLYRGFASAEIYDMNLDYMRFNREKEFIHLPIEYDCCSDPNEIYPRRIWASEQSFQEEKVDNYRNFLPNNYTDIEGEFGEITGMYNLGNSLFIQTREGTWQLPQNKQERVTNEVVSFIGTGSLFSILPRKVLDDDLGSLGTLHKWANIKTRVGMFSVSETEHKVFLHSDTVKEISSDGIQSFCQENIRSYLYDQLYNMFGIDFPNTNNTANLNGTGYISTYDSKFDRILITKRDYLLLPDKLDSLVIVSTKPIDEDSTDFVYNIEEGLFYQGITVINLNNKDYFEDKSFTLSYSLRTRKWVSWHSYLPNYYIHSKDRLFSFYSGDNNLYKHNIEGSYQTFKGVYYPHIIEGVIRSTDLQDKLFEDITIQTKALSYSIASKQFIDKKLITFNKITINNERQCSGELFMQVKQTQTPTTDYFNNQTRNILGTILISREINGWAINKLRDFIIDYDEPLFTSDWEKTKDRYFIDKVINSQSISFNKNWRELQSFKGKYIIFRLKFDNFDTVNLITSYLISTTNIST